MNTIFYMLQKEFLHVVRNRVMLPLIFVVPIVQLVLLGYAATLEIKNVDLYIIDNDNTTLSALYIDGFEHSAYFTITGTGHSTESANEAIAKRIAKMALIIPTDFEKDIFNGIKNPGSKISLNVKTKGKAVVKVFFNNISVEDVSL